MIALWVAKLFSYSEIAPAPIVPVGFLATTSVGFFVMFCLLRKFTSSFLSLLAFFQTLPAG
jgi:hypothetical protein